MQPKQHVSPSQAACLTYASFFGISLYAFIKTYLITGRAGWVANIAGILLILPLAWWLLYLANLYPGNTILEIIEITTGKIVSKLINIVFIFLSIILAACILNFFGSLTQIFFLPNTPIWVVMLVITTISTLMARDGLEVLGRFIYLLVIFVTLIYFPVMSLGAGQFRIENITPIFVVSPLQFAKGVYLEAGLYAEGLLSLMIMAAALPKPNKYYKAITAGSLIVAFTRGISGVIVFSLLGVERIFGITMHVAIIAAQSIQGGGFLYGLEILIYIVFIMNIYSTIPIHFLTSWMALTQIFNHRKSDVYWWALFITITGAAIGLNSFNTALTISTFLAEYVLLPYVVLVLTIASVGCWVKGRKKTV